MKELPLEFLNIESADVLAQDKIRGSLFENFVISECYKWYYAKKITPNLYFWRDEEGHEIDLLIDRNRTLYPVEIKSASAGRNTMTDKLVFWHNLTGHALENSYVIYTGAEDNSAKGPQFVPWETIPEWLTNLFTL